MIAKKCCKITKYPDNSKMKYSLKSILSLLYTFLTKKQRVVDKLWKNILHLKKKIGYPDEETGNNSGNNHDIYHV
jgi:hypothetical protein